MKTKTDTAYFRKEALEYLAELHHNNDRKWFLANKDRYEEFVKTPMRELAVEMIRRMQEYDPGIVMGPDEALFGITRDTRLSADKTPYKTHVGLLIARKGASSFAHPGLYVQVSHNAFSIASGFHALEPSQTIAIRRHIAANPKEFLTQLGNRAFQAHFLGIRGDVCKVLPPELRAAADNQPLIYNRQFYYWAQHGADRALFSELPNFIMQHMEACRGMNDFLGQAFGAAV